MRIGILSRNRMLDSTRRLTQAAHYLDAYLQRAPDAADAQVIRDGMKDLLDEWVAQN